MFELCYVILINCFVLMGFLFIYIAELVCETGLSWGELAGASYIYIYINDGR